MLKKNSQPIDTKLLAEWHPTRNEKLDPKQIPAKSNKKVWWKCNQGHEWQTIIADRTNGTGCPFCSGRFATKDNNLAVLFPELIKQWHPTKNDNIHPHNLKPYSNKKVWWICKNKHEWNAAIYSRTNGAGCPFCTGLFPTFDNNLAIMVPDIAKLWHPTKNSELKPYEVTPNSRKKIWWLCKKGHEWKSVIYSHSKCPYCSGRKAGADNNLFFLFPQIAIQWHPIKNGMLKPYNVTSQSNKTVWWICSSKHEWQAQISNRTTRGDKCPQCTGHIPSSSYNLGISFPVIAAQWNYSRNGNLKPENVTPHSDKKVWWICSKKHEWFSTVKHRVDGSGCPHCSKRISKKGTAWLNSKRIIIRERTLIIGNSKFTVDGYDPIEKRIYEFLGDYWHGNPNKHKAEDINPSIHRTYGELFQETMKRFANFVDAGYSVTYRWESSQIDNMYVAEIKF
jgi:hypothetical protein